MSEPDAPIRTPRSQRLLDFRQRRLPLLVWLASAALCAWMLADRTQRFEYIALAQTVEYEVSAPATGRLDSVFVDLYDTVRAGDVVAQLSDAKLEARIERARASIRMLSAQLMSERAELQSESGLDLAGWTEDLRRFQIDEEQRRLSVLGLRAAIRADELELERLERRLNSADPLLESGIIGRLAHDEVRLERDQVAEEIDQNRQLLLQTEEEFLAAQRRRRDFEMQLPELPREGPFLEPFREAIAVETQRLREIEAQHEELVLRSPIDGEVSSILCRNGQAVTPGEPILTITDRQVQDIVAWLGDTDRRDVAPNAPVRVTSRNGAGRSTESFVVRVGSGLEMLPRRLWNHPATPRYGRAVIIAALPQMQLKPGELLNVSFLND